MIFLSEIINFSINLKYKKYIFLYTTILLLFAFHCKGFNDSLVIKGFVHNSPFNEISIQASYNPDSFVIVESYTVKIIDSTFIFKGTIKNCTGVRLFIKDNLNYLSEWFYIDAGMQNLQINFKDELIDVTSDAEIFYENKIKFKNFKDSVKLRNPNIKIDSLLYLYSMSNPNSQFGMMEFYYSLQGFDSIYDKTFDNFSNPLKKSFLGKAVYKKIQSHKRVEVGSIFPDMSIFDIRDNEVNLASITKNKYTLIEFWHSWCGYCIKEFPEIKKLYFKFSGDNFNVISISTDLSKHKPNWKETIEKNKLPWEQYIDLNGVKSKEFGIRYFPQNFLLEKNGKIIAKNIDASIFNTVIDLVSKYLFFR